MKKLLFILLLFPLTLFATNYFVSNTGSDAAAGTSEGAAWQTIAKVNAFWAAGSFVPGDTIKLNMGDTWNEKLVISEGGTSGNPIVITSYGTGDLPVITGFSTIGMWTALNDSIDYVVIATSNNPTFVAVDSEWKAMGRYPNTGYKTITANPTTGKIVSTGLGNTPNWTGAEAVIRVRNWITDRCTITSHNTDTINYTRRSAYNPVAGWGFFIQNSLSTLDTQFEWFYDGDTLFMHNGGESLGLYTIQVPTIDTLLYGAGYDRIHVDGIKFTGSGRNAIHTFNFADYWEIKNCEFDLNGENAIYFQNQQRYTTVDNNTINRSVRAGIYMASSGNNTVTNNNIKNSGMLLGGSNTGTENNGIYSNDHVYGANNLFQYNEIDSSGYNGIYFLGNNSQVKNNYIKNSVLLLNDGGGIYTQGLGSVRRLIESNIVLNSYGNFDGTVPVIDWASGDTMRYGEGIYLDAGGTTAGVHGSYDVRIINNTIAGNGQNGICIHEAYSDTLTGNLSYNNRNAAKFQSFTSTQDSANYMHNNTLFARKYIDHFTFRTNLHGTDFIDSDNNYFLRPVSDYENIALWVTGSGWKAFDLAYWQSEYGHDLNSTGSTEVAIDEDQFVFRYNPTNGDSTFTIAENVVTVAGDAFTGDTVISAYSSAVFTIQQSTDVPAIVSDSIDIATRKHLFVFSNITGDGGSAVTGRGVCYSIVGIPTVDSSKVTNGTGTGTFMTRMDNMLPETTYFIRPYATNANGTKYGDMWTVTTPKYNYLVNKAGKLLTDKSGKLIKYDPEVTPDSDPYCAEYRTVYDAMTVKPSDYYATIDNAMVQSLVDGGYWARMDQFLVPSIENNNSGDALINWKNLGTYNASNGANAPTWTALEGYTGNANNQYIESNFDASQHATNYTLNSGTIGVYTRVDLQEAVGNIFGILDGSGNRTSLLLRNTSDNSLSRINNVAGSSYSVANPTSTGLFILTRTADNVNTLYKNGSALGSGSVASSEIPAGTFWILGVRGVGGVFTANQFSIFFVMNGVSSDDAAAINTIIETRMDAIGKGVQ